MEWWIRLEAVNVWRVPEAVEGICYVPETVEVVVCVLEVPEAMPCVLLYMLEAVEGVRCMPEAVEGVRYVLKLLNMDAPCATLSCFAHGPFAQLLFDNFFVFFPFFLNISIYMFKPEIRSR